MKPQKNSAKRLESIAERPEDSRERPKLLLGFPFAPGILRRGSAGLAQIDFEILNGRDEQILDLLPPQATPAGRLNPCSTAASPKLRS